MQQVEPWIVDLVRQTGTPHFIFDLHATRRQLQTFNRLFPHVTPFYSTKTCSVPAVIDTCLQAGWKFDAATIPEIEMLLGRGALAGDILYTHPVKTVHEIERAYALGVRRFTCDRIEELEKIALHAPGAEIFVRFAPPKDSSLYNYRQRLGASAKELKPILDYAVQHQLAVHGISFHVGSQSLKVQPWERALAQIRKLIAPYYTSLPMLRQINIGSGFPVAYDFKKIPELDAIAACVQRESAKFPADFSFLAEPGRIIAAPSATLVVSVIENLRRGNINWLFTDTSVYSALIERLESGGKFRYAISSTIETGPKQLYNIAGKTLDPDDIIADNVLLSRNLKAGDLLFVHDVGAYTAEFATAYHSLPRPLISIHDSEHMTDTNAAPRSPATTLMAS